jgi:hypothetical protein
MRVFSCGNCGQMVFFDNNRCLRCQSPLGYVHARRDLVAMTEVEPGRLVDLSGGVQVWQRCATEPQTGCNWLVPFGAGPFCESCLLTRIRPADNNLSGLAELVGAERAKRRMLFQLAELGLPVIPRVGNKGLAFDLLSSSETKVITGHDDGVITLDLAEVEDEHRERLRHDLNEPYRTVLGHFRHEIGHYYWPILVTEPDVRAACRALFGDDRADYAAAVQRHYSSPEPAGWEWAGSYISRYAAMHPYEDWAETFAHYLHIQDALQTARSFRLDVHSLTGDRGPFDHEVDGSFGALIDDWLRLSYALNQLNQSLGQDEVYPFVLTPTVIRKLTFIDQVIARRTQTTG